MTKEVVAAFYTETFSFRYFFFQIRPLSLTKLDGQNDYLRFLPKYLIQHLIVVVVW